MSRSPNWSRVTAELVARYVCIGARSFSLDVPASEEELRHTGVCELLRRRRVNALLQDYATRAARRSPSKVTLVMPHKELTYGELESESNRLARLLGRADSQIKSRGYRIELAERSRPLSTR